MSEHRIAVPGIGTTLSKLSEFIDASIDLVKSVDVLSAEFTPKLADALLVALQAYSQKTVKEMQKSDESLTRLAQQKHKLEQEVKALEQRKHKALSSPKPAQPMKEGTKPLQKKEPVATVNGGPLIQKPFAALAELVKSEVSAP